MKVLMQRVRMAQVVVEERTVGKIGKGLLLFIGVEAQDSECDIARMAERVVGYRLFADDNDKMNLDVRDVGGSILAVSQFTLAADTRKGRRPSFSSAAPPQEAQRLYGQLVHALRDCGVTVECGEFGADMQVSLVNDGPVTFLLE